MLPGMDGLACLKQLQLQAASQPALRVVIVTALNDADKKEEALANGAEAYVLKPDLFDGNRRATAPKQLALLGRDHPLANQTIERLIKTLRSRGWNQHPDQREPSKQRTRRLCSGILWMGHQLRASGARFQSLNPDATAALHRVQGQ